MTFSSKHDRMMRRMGRSKGRSNMSSAALLFLVLSIAIGMVFGMSTYAIVAGVLMLILVGIVHFTGILPE
jgi:hypothetical protein